MHVGFHKTGSTTIQNFCRLNGDVLAARNVHYARSGLRNGAHFNLSSELTKKSTFVGEVGTWSDLRAEILANPTCDFLISSEDLHILAKPKIEAIREYLDGIAVRVIVYIRTLSDHVVSTYAQRVKTGALYSSFDEFFDAMVNGPRNGAFIPDLGKWAATFGWDAIRVRTLDPASLTGGDLITDFLSAIGLDRADLADQLDAASFAIRNTAPGWKSLELIKEAHALSGALPTTRAAKQAEGFRDLRRIAIKIRKAGEAAAATLGLDQDRTQYLTLAQWRWCQAAYRRELAHLNDRVADRLPEPDWHEPPERPFLPGVEEIPASERAGFAQEMLRELLPLLAKGG